MRPVGERLFRLLRQRSQRQSGGAAVCDYTSDCYAHAPVALIHSLTESILSYIIKKALYGPAMSALFFVWRAGPDSNRWMAVLQTAALASSPPALAQI